MIFIELFSTKYYGERGGEWGEGLYKNTKAQKISKIEFTWKLPKSHYILESKQSISIDPGRYDDYIVPNPKTPWGNGFLKVCAEF
jgi:hypothetical protein